MIYKYRPRIVKDPGGYGVMAYGRERYRVSMREESTMTEKQILAEMKKQERAAKEQGKKLAKSLRLAKAKQKAELRSTMGVHYRAFTSKPTKESLKLATKTMAQFTKLYGKKTPVVVQK